MHIQYLIILGLMTTSSFVVSQEFDRPIPSYLHSFQFKKFASSPNLNYFIAPYETGQKETTKKVVPMILDSLGYLVLYILPDAEKVYDFKFHPEKELYSYMALEDSKIKYLIHNKDFNKIDSLSNSPGLGSDVHELQIAENGNYLIGGYDLDTVELVRPTMAGGLRSIRTIIKGYIIEELDSNHDQLFCWNSNDHIDPLDGHAAYKFDSILYNYCHGNAIDISEDGHFLVSFRNLNAIYKVDRKTGKPHWILGGKSSKFAFSNDAGFSGQHDVRDLGDGYISLLDCGNTSVDSISRAVIYKLDTINWRATLEWEYYDPRPFFSRAMGNHQVASDGLHLINFGLSKRPHTNLSLVDSQSKLVSQLIFEDGIATYRAYVFRNTPGFKRSEIICSKNAEGLQLFAADEASTYHWSNGATTRVTKVNKPGTYQVWLNKANLMIGSWPISIKNESLTCPMD